MATITIRNLDDSLKKRLRLAAARHGCSMEEEVRRILRRNLMPQDEQTGTGSRIHQHFKQAGGIELSVPARSLPRQQAELFEE